MWFALIADEASDISLNEQMCISVRWVNDSMHEDPLGLVQLPDTKAETLFRVLKDVLIRCSLPIVLCRGQAYDRASNMNVIQNGVQALVIYDSMKTRLDLSNYQILTTASHTV